jgi:DNA-binding transcriptional ArsR family regulator
MLIGGFDHDLKAPLRAAIGGLTDVDEIVETVLHLLHDHRMISYRGDHLAILGPAGRVLADLALHPEATTSEISVRLGVTNSSVTKQMTNLVRANLIERTRVGRRNHYRLPLTSLLNHPDIAGILHAVIIAGRAAQSPRTVAAQAENTSSEVGTIHT